VNLLIEEKNNMFEKDIKIIKNDWKYSLDIEIDISLMQISSIKIKKNLLFILKCYLLEPTSMIKAIYLISKEKDENINIYYKISIKKIKKIKIYDFDSWIDEMIEEEKHYFINSKCLGFRIVFYNESISWFEGKIYPNMNDILINELI
jgi:hypothetical protein